MFLLYHSEGCNTSEMMCHLYYINDLYSMQWNTLGHRILSAETQGVAALRSVADMLRKSAEDSFKSMDKYQLVIDEASKNSF